MLRDNIVNEVSRILLGPINGVGERLNKNPLDFYSVGVLFPQQSILQDYASQDDQSVGSGVEVENIIQNEASDSIQKSNEKKRALLESKEPEANGELELTTKFLPSAAGISVLINKNSVIEITVSFATYKKSKIENVSESNDQRHFKNQFIYTHIPHSFIIKFHTDSVILEILHLPKLEVL